MADWEIESKGSLRGEIALPGDKSISHRSVILGAIAKGTTRVRGWLKADDVQRTIQAFQMLGVEIKIGDELLIKGAGRSGLKPANQILDLGNSGTGLRLISGILAGQTFESILTGDETLRRRPMKRIIEPLALMGAQIQSRENGLAPLKIKGGNLTGIDYQMPVASAQVKSAILLASVFARGRTKITEPSRSRDHTENMLGYFGAQLKKAGLQIEFECGQDLSAQEIEVPGDISSAAFFIIAGLIVPGSEILIRKAGLNPTRTGILDALKMMGARIEILNLRSASGEPVGDLLIKSQPLKAIEIKGRLVPRLIDEIPILCVAATQAQGTTIIKDARELRVKESDRIRSMAEELKKLGAKVEELEDGMVIEGPVALKGAEVQSRQDHRVAMSLAVAGLAAEGKTIVRSVEWVDTSFPEFLKKLNQLVA